MTATSETQRPKFAYIPGLDGIRGIWVVIGPLMYHAAPDTIPGGILGIDLFFVLSSFLITNIALTEFAKTGTMDLKAYAGRRVRRLFPALFFALLLLTLYMIVYVDQDQYPRWTGAIVSTLTYSANWYEIFSDVSYFEQFDNESPLRHVWSFSIEEQFYIFAPLFFLAIFALFKARAHKALFVTMIFGAILSAWWMGRLYPGGGDPSRVYFGTDTRAHSLFVGIIFAVGLWMWGEIKTHAAKRTWVLGAYAATIFFSVAIFEITERTAWMFEHGGFLMVAVISAIMVVGITQPTEGAWHAFLGERAKTDVGRYAVGAAYAGLWTLGWATVSVVRGNAPFDHWPYLVSVAIGWFVYGSSGTDKGPLHWFLESDPIRWIGKISYGLYLYHWPIYLLVTPERAGRLIPGVDTVEDNNLILIHLVLTFIVATFSFYVIEQPVLKRQFPVIPKPVTLASGSLVGATAVVAILGGLLWINADQDEAEAAAVNVCDQQRSVLADDEVLRVMVVGDSVALQIGEALCQYSVANPGEILVFNESHLGCIIARYGEKVSPGFPIGPVGDVCSAWNDPVTVEAMLDPGVVSWPTAVEAFQPDVVIGHITPWDVNDRLVPSLGDELVWIGVPEYDDYIRSEYRIASETLGGGGAQVYWLEGAHLNKEPFTPQNDPERIDRLNELVQETTVDLDYVNFIAYRDFIGPNDSDREQAIRDDGVHLSAQGTDEVPVWLMEQFLSSELAAKREAIQLASG